jgi:hypothetical protein
VIPEVKPAAIDAVCDWLLTAVRIVPDLIPGVLAETAGPNIVFRLHHANPGAIHRYLANAGELAALETRSLEANPPVAHAIVVNQGLSRQQGAG